MNSTSAVHLDAATLLAVGREIQLFRVGAIYSPHTGDLRLEVTDEMLASIVQAMANRSSNDPVPIDLRHASTSNDAALRADERNIPLGEIDARTLRHEPGVGLFGRPRWTERGRALVARSGGTFRVSPAPTRGNGYDVRTGEDLGGPILVAVALTEDPAQDGLQPVELSASAEEGRTMDKPIDGNALAELTARAESAERDVAKLTAARDAATAQVAELSAKLDALTAERPELQTKIDELSATVEQMRQAEHRRQRDAVIDAAIGEGRITEASRERFARIYDLDARSCVDALSSLPASSAWPATSLPSAKAPADLPVELSTQRGYLTELNRLISKGDAKTEREARDIIEQNHPGAFDRVFTRKGA